MTAASTDWDFAKDAASDPQAPKAPPEWESRIIVTPSVWYTDAPPKRDWLLRDSRTRRGVLPLGKVGQIIAEGGAGKTIALIQAAIALATCTPWLGTFLPEKEGRSLLVLGEEDALEAQRRIYNARRSANTPTPPDGSIVVLPLAGVVCAMIESDERGDVVDAPFLPWLVDYLTKNGPFSLVGIDPLSRFAGPKAETDNAAATRFIQALESLIVPSGGATVLNLHHVNKMSRSSGHLDASSGRGSSAFVDGARWQASLGVERVKLEHREEQERLGEIVTFTVTKSNYAMKPEPVLLRRDRDHGGALHELDAADLAAVNEARKAKAATKPAGDNGGTVPPGRRDLA